MATIERRPPRLEQRLGEAEGDLLAGEALVDGGEGVHLVLDVRELRLVQVYLQELLAVELDARTLADHLGGEHQVREDRVVDGGEGARPRALLLLRAAVLAAQRLLQDAALKSEELALKSAKECGTFLT